MWNRFLLSAIWAFLAVGMFGVLASTLEAQDYKARQQLDSLPNASFVWVPNGWQRCTQACGPSSQSRNIVCKTELTNQLVDDQYCTGLTKPAATQACTDYRSCTHQWQTTPWVTVAGCGATTQARSVSCLRSSGHTVPNTACPAPVPGEAQSAIDYSLCTFDWEPGDWSDWSDGACSDNATRTRTISCLRSDGTSVADSNCNAGSRPADNETAAVYDGCEIKWETTAWSGWSSDCSATASRSRTVECKRADGSGLPDSSCTNRGQKPASTEVDARYTACSHAWESTDWTDFEDGCSDATTRTRTRLCRRQETGEVVDDLYCNLGTRPTVSEVASNYEGCNYSWQTDDWGSWSDDCADSTSRTRPVTCQRDGTGATVADSFCEAGTKPTGTDTGSSYSGCSYVWRTDDWTAWDSGCADAANRTRVATCFQDRPGDSDPSVAANLCSAGSKPSESETAANYASCTYEWQSDDWSAWADGCSDSTSRTRTITCLRQETGGTVADNLCNAGTKPVDTDTGPNYDGCVYSWQTTSWSSWSDTCDDAANRTRTVTCRRDGTGSTVADSFCDGGSKPSASETQALYTGCSYVWRTDAWSSWSNTCADDANRTRTATCYHDRPGGTDPAVADSSCAAGSRPSESETQGVYSGCTYSWQNTSWSSWDNSCSDSANRTRTVSCLRNENGSTVTDSFCNAGTKPASSETQAVYDSCAYVWEVGGWSAWDDTCSDGANRSRTVRCYQDRPGASDPYFPDASCVNDPKPTTSETQSIYSGCTYSWQSTSWSAWADSCSDSTTRSRTVTCLRDGTGSTVSDSYCNAGTKPSVSETSSNYAGCTYSWQTTSWSGWDSTCADGANRTRTVSCQRGATGATVADSFCNAGTKPAGSDTQSVYSGCSYVWRTDAWSAWNSTCSDGANRTRTATCYHDRPSGSDPAVADSSCSAGTRPSESDTQAVYTGCSYSWQSTSWSGWLSGCSDDTTRTRTVTCLRDGTGSTVSDSFCNAGTKPTTSENGSNYASCTYSWQSTSWSSWDSSCSDGANRTRTVTCLRDGTGSTVTDSFCNAGTKPSASDTQAVYTSCSYVWRTNSWSGWDSTCSDSANRTRTATCYQDRPSGTDPAVADSSCAAGSRPSESENQAVYSGCTYSWISGSWGSYGSSCSDSTSRSRSVTCRRDGTGATVADSYCNAGTKPSTSETNSNYSGCTYSWQSSSWSSWGSSCSDSTSRSRTVTCQRDGTGSTVTDSYCNAGTKPTTSETSSNYSGCTYSWISGSWGSWANGCSDSTTRTRLVTCRRDGTGATVSDSNCSAGTKPSNSDTGSNYSSCSYYWYSSSWSSWSSSCSDNANRTRTVNCREDRPSGSDPVVTDGNCSGSKPSSSETQGRYSGCSYYTSYGSWSSWSSSCSSNATRSRSRTCKQDRPSGSDPTVSDSNCGFSGSETQNQAIYSGCTYSWIYGSWGSYNSSCSDTATRTRSVTCRRSDGTNVSSSTCVGQIGNHAGSSESTAIYSGCPYYWSTGSWGGWSACVSPGTQSRSRSVSCKQDRPSGSDPTVSNSSCSGSTPSSSQNQACGGTWSSAGNGYDTQQSPSQYWSGTMPLCPAVDGSAVGWANPAGDFCTNTGSYCGWGYMTVEGSVGLHDGGTGNWYRVFSNRCDAN